jgi:hypothetical protein
MDFGVKKSPPKENVASEALADEHKIVTIVGEPVAGAGGR